MSAAKEPTRYHFTDEASFVVETAEGEVPLGKGWLAISEAEYATLSAPALPSQEDVARVIRGVYGFGEGTFRGGWQDKSIDSAAAAILALMGQTGDGWLPIESAPKDGRLVILAGVLGQQWIGSWRLPILGEPQSQSHYEPEWRDGGGRWSTPTHWRPLPAPPAKEGR